MPIVAEEGWLETGPAPGLLLIDSLIHHRVAERGWGLVGRGS